MSWLAALVEARGGFILPAENAPQMAAAPTHRPRVTDARCGHQSPDRTAGPSLADAPRPAMLRPSEIPHGPHAIRAQIETVLCARCRRPLHDAVERWIGLCATCETTQPSDAERDRHADRLTELSRGELEVDES